MELTPKTVKETVTGWNIIFPGNRSDAELAFLCGKFYQHLWPVYSNEDFVVAAGLTERETHFFPTIKAMLDVRESVHQIRQRQISADQKALKALPEETGNLTPEEIEQNKKRVEIIKLQLAGDLTMEEAEAAQKKITTYAAKRQ